MIKFMQKFIYRNNNFGLKNILNIKHELALNERKTYLKVLDKKGNYFHSFL